MKRTVASLLVSVGVVLQCAALFRPEMSYLLALDLTLVGTLIGCRA